MTLHLPALPPGLVRSLGPTGKGNPGVGAVNIDAAIGVERSVNQGLNVRFPGDIGDHRRAADFRRHPLGGLAIDVRHHDLARPIGRNTPAQRAADAAPATRHDHDAATDFHR